MAIQGRSADAQCRGDVAHRMLVRPHRLRGRQLLRTQRRRSPAKPTASPRSGQAGAGTLPDRLALELRQRPEDVETADGPAASLCRSPPSEIGSRTRAHGARRSTRSRASDLGPAGPGARPPTCPPPADGQSRHPAEADASAIPNQRRGTPAYSRPLPARRAAGRDSAHPSTRARNRSGRGSPAQWTQGDRLRSLG